MSKLCRIGLLMIPIMILHHSKLHMLERCGIYGAYAAYIKKVLHYKQASLTDGDLR